MGSKTKLESVDYWLIAAIVGVFIAGVMTALHPVGAPAIDLSPLIN